MNYPLATAFDYSLVEALVETDQSSDSGSRITHLQKKATIFRQHESCQAIYQVQSGLIKSCRITTDGVEQITNFHLPGEIFGFESLLLPTYSTNTIAMTDASVFKIILKDIQQSDDIYETLYKYLTQEYIRSQRHLAMLNKTRAEVRVAAFIGDILQRKSKNGERVQEFAFGRMDMASYLGLSVETVCRVLKRLKLAGAIKVEKTRIQVADWDKLTRLGSY